MSELKCTHSCSDCGKLACRSASEDQYPPFCLTTSADKELLAETLDIYKNDELQGKIARTSACIEGEFYGRLTRVEETIEFIKRRGFKKDRHRVLRRSDARNVRLYPHSQGRGNRLLHRRLQGRRGGQDRNRRAE